MNYYEYLGLTPGASFTEIKNSYKKLAKEFHPDKQGDSNKFKELNNIYNILNNPESRNDYDCFGEKMPKLNTNTGYYEIFMDTTLENIYNKDTVNLLLNYSIECQNCINKKTSCNCINGRLYLKKRIIILHSPNPKQIELPNKNYVVIFKLQQHKYFTLENNQFVLELDMPLFHNLTKSFLFKCLFLDNKSEIIVNPDFIINPEELIYVIKNVNILNSDFNSDLVVKFNIIFPEKISDKKIHYLKKIFKISDINNDDLNNCKKLEVYKECNMIEQSMNPFISMMPGGCNTQ
jgi:DnaJ-class molecular chaperone